MRHHAQKPIVRRTALVAGAAVAALFAAGQVAALPVPGSAPATLGGGTSQPIIQVGSTDVRVDLNAPRTIIDWTSFNLSGGERAEFRFDQRNWIVLNRVQNSAINIDGQVVGYQAANLNSALPAQTSGNVWFYSPQGVAFGGGARVDVGGMLATSAAVNEAQFLNAGNLQIGFTGSGSGGPVTVASGAQLQGLGYLALVAPQVSTAAGASVTAGDVGTAAYAAVDSYEITFLPAQQDLTFFTFLVPGGGAAGSPHPTPLNVAGTTTAANIYLMAISRQAVTGLLINAPGLLTGRSSIDNYGQVTITTGRNIISGQVGQTSTNVVGARAGSVQLGEINASGNVNVFVTGRFGTSDLTANRIRAGQGLSIAARDVTIGSGGVVVGDSNVNAGGMAIDTLGAVTIPSLTVRTNLSIGTGQFQAGGPTDVLPVLQFGTVNVGGDINSVAETLNVTAMTATNIASSTAGATAAGTLTGSNNVLVAASTHLTLGTVTAGALTRLTFEDLTLTGAVTATDAVLRILTPSQAIVGGTGADRRLTNAEFQRFTVRNSLSIYGGIEGQFPVTNDLIVDDLDVDAAKIPELRLYAKATNDVIIRGNVLPSGEGVVLKIGDAIDVDSVWKPDQIIVTGALGSAEGDALAGFTEVKAFDRVEMVATNDILIGSQRFIDLIADVPATGIDINRSLPLGVAPVEDEVGKLFLVSGSASLFAEDRIVQQNTGLVGSQAGFYLTGVGVDPADPLLTVGGAVIADMFGALQEGDGIVLSGSAASSSRRIGRIDGDTSAGAIRINGCAVGIGCTLSTPASQFRIQQFRPAAPRAAIDPPVLTPPPPVDEDEREAESVITGAGNEEIWRRDR
ncbi:MAG: filamentous hemagglutinin N-terminal domain-containing protein [Phenylobacterium sp.]|uniref:two-partner secretion domain-containing protein n=1 Tax=Phenylobacterium sp. TaxID=1871053 RepID=UPI00120D018C|nr:filamentous hemagglutinin N-terminal domain-containing protein [Phenylobacterium sp.]TAJ74826.1 MAG: filamentous hemagglutinin N-terminal domain-containing protein [Phenylobacterium sp.]